LHKLCGGPKEACGVFGIYGHKQAAELSYLGLYALQHRGQESAGIVVSDRRQLKAYKGMGLVADVFTPGTTEGLSGDIAIGHIRYSTMGSSSIKNAQPFLVEYSRGQLAIGHNGNLVNAKSLRDELEAAGSIFQSTMDTEIIIHLLAKSTEPTFEEALGNALGRIKGAYSLTLLRENQLIAVRDPHGWRPLCLGKLDDSFVVASETCALDLIQAQYIRDVEPGEVLFIDKDGLHSFKPLPKTSHAFCIFEYIYFARPDSNIFGGNVYAARKALGARLAEEYPVEADLVVPIPDSGNFAALGFAESASLPFEPAIIRNHYIGRTFIQPSQAVRDLGVKVKLNPVRELIKGKRIAIIEDSIVRGTTSKARLRALREAGAKELHMRVSCPPLISPCYYGIDFPTKEELIATRLSVEEIRKSLGLDSLAYLSLEGMLASMPLPKEEFCTACFTEDYPIPPEELVSKEALERPR
jgi:amidophosphoribosyltransferase